MYQPKKKAFGGTEYLVRGSTSESERGVTVFQSFSTTAGRVIVENGRVNHPDGRITTIGGTPIDVHECATEENPYYYKHPEGQPLCSCDWPSIWYAWPHECRNCGRILCKQNVEPCRRRKGMVVVVKLWS